MASGSSTFTAAWTPPDPVTGFAATVVEDYSYIQLNWSPSPLNDASFGKYAVYRKKRNSTEWEKREEISSKSTTEHLDALAGNRVAYDYKVTQFEIVGANSVESGDSEIVGASLESDRWYIISNGNPRNIEYSFTLPVVEEVHTRPIQQEVFEPIVGNRKKIARGNVLGYEGSMKLMWAHDEVDQGKVWLDFVVNNSGPHILKSPFGDVWYVEFDAPSYRYLMVGHLEVDIGWIEVF